MSQVFLVIALVATIVSIPIVDWVAGKPGPHPPLKNPDWNGWWQ